MSQKKVDQYKKDKANRKKIIAKQKRQEFFAKFMTILVTGAFVGFIVLSAYFKWFDKKDTTVEAATYSLSEEEISSVWEAYTEEAETTVAETTSADNSSSNESETTAASEEETTSVK